ncbi:hypothetical protein EW146_g4916 [Bondarzewia mesenterica]|uniref:Uncharacterized protein n=1 Tax=Bondarzewia mesenterica TaxID=1095465 RepID=A0A4S4LT34_9AGAM|nr:hypothetical protein EW146_g4916 [Bondarzewia mesenterica]
MGKGVLGAEHPATLLQGDSQAEDLQAVADARKKVLGEDRPDTLSSMGNLAAFHKEQGRLKAQAEELEIQVLETMKRVLGEEYPDTLWIVGNLAYTYRKQQCRQKEAEALKMLVTDSRR